MDPGKIGIDLKDAVGSVFFPVCRCDFFSASWLFIFFHSAPYFLRVASTSRRKHFRTSGSYITYMIFTYIIYLHYATIYFTRLIITWPWHVILPCIHHDYDVPSSFLYGIQIIYSRSNNIKLSHNQHIEMYQYK